MSRIPRICILKQELVFLMWPFWFKFYTHMCWKTKTISKAYSSTKVQIYIQMSIRQLKFIINPNFIIIHSKLSKQNSTSSTQNLKIITDSSLTSDVHYISIYRSFCLQIISISRSWSLFSLLPSTITMLQAILTISHGLPQQHPN